MHLPETFININISQHEIAERQICQNCLIKFNEIDEHQTIVEKIQNELVELYNNSVSNSMDIKNVVKMENFDFAEVDVAEDQFQSEVDDYFSYNYERIKKKYKKRRKKEEYEEDRRIKHDKSDDNAENGFTVTMLEGRKHFKCNICHKILYRRLKMHMGTHSSERNVKCQECGALFKTMACLYTHRKIHRERKYHIW